MARRLPPRLHDDALVDEIFTRLPAADATRFRAVSRAWNAHLTSDDFVRARAAARQPELLFFAPAAGSDTMSLYTCTLRDGEAPSNARELVTVSNLTSAEHLVVLSPRPCRGLTLLAEAPASAYYLCNLSTGEHVALPACAPAAAVEPWCPMRVGMGSHKRMHPFPVRLESTGLGFDETSGEHKVVRLFTDQSDWQNKCEVWAASASGWRPCAGHVPPAAADFVVAMPPVFVGGHLYWLVEVGEGGGARPPAILSFSVADEQFAWVPTTPPVRRICHLADFDGALCAVIDVRHEINTYAFYTWNGIGAPWSLRCWIDLHGLPQPISDEFVEEQHVLPLCSAAGGKKILLATGRHKVFAYDPKTRTMERVFRAHEFIDVPRRHSYDANLRLCIALHEERIVDRPDLLYAQRGNSRLQIKLGSNTIDNKREVPDDVYRDDTLGRDQRKLYKDIAAMLAVTAAHGE